MNWGTSRFKRVIDLLLASVGLVALVPVLLLTAIVVRLKLGSPVLFRQVRVGLRQKQFTLYKFRTMTDQRDSQGNLLPDEQRVTGLGKFLRNSSIDELPELWNVVRGEMSLVGPRPLLVEYLDVYTNEQNRRHDVRPGLTGWQQISGRNLTEWKIRMAQDVWYVDNCSFWLDVRILCRTVLNVITRHGVESKDGLTPEKFKGEN